MENLPLQYTAVEECWLTVRIPFLFTQGEKTNRPDQHPTRTENVLFYIPHSLLLCEETAWQTYGGSLSDRKGFLNLKCLKIAALLDISSTY